MQGYIKLHRQLLDNPLFNSETFTKGQAWITLLMLTNHKANFLQVKNGEMIKIERGECGYSELALAKIFKWSRGKVKRYLKTLETQKMIQQKKVSDRNIIKVINYENYQDDTTNDTTNGHQTVQQTDINNNDKNDKNDKNVINSFLNRKKIKKLDPYIDNPIIDKFRTEHKRVFGNKIYLDSGQRQRIMELNADIEGFVETISETFERLKNIDFDLPNFNPNGAWLLRDNNYTNVLNGLYNGKKKTDIWEELKEKERMRNGTT
jgi:predicted nucleic-acid-binding Zn-ribbon protein